VGSNPTPRTSAEPSELPNFGLWLRRKGNRDSTIERELKFLKHLPGDFEDMVSQVLTSKWVDKSKAMALKTIQYYPESKGFKITVPAIKVYDNSEMYVPNPEMVRRLVYRIRSLPLRSAVLLATETGASASEVLGVTWKDLNLATKTVIIKGVKGHRTTNYQVSDELAVPALTMTSYSARGFLGENSALDSEKSGRYRSNHHKQNPESS